MRTGPVFQPRFSDVPLTGPTMCCFQHPMIVWLFQLQPAVPSQLPLSFPHLLARSFALSDIHSSHPRFQPASFTTYPQPRHPSRAQIVCPPVCSGGEVRGEENSMTSSTTANTMLCVSAALEACGGALLSLSPLPPSLAHSTPLAHNLSESKRRRFLWSVELENGS